MASRRKKRKLQKKNSTADTGFSRATLDSSNGENFAHTPFANLKKLLKESKEPGKSAASPKEKKTEGPESKTKSHIKSPPVSMRDPEIDDHEYQLFLKEMEDVDPASWKKKTTDPLDTVAAPPAIKPSDEEQACRKELENLLEGKSEIPVEHTPEYMEGPQINSNPRIVRKLRRGKFSVQSYCDLHGLTAREALEWCDEFMKRSLAADRSCIAIIHGRGLSSPRGPVLKKMVHEWLTKGRWRRHIIAFSSAPNWDGGPGVTYVLLRQKPAPRKKRKKRRLWSD